MEKKIIVSGEKAREKLLKGVETIGSLVGNTLGPYGRNSIIQRKYKAPLITNDGVTIARYTYLEDEIEDLGAQTLVEAALKTNDQAGDGTTTTVVFANELTRSVFETIKKDEGPLMGKGNVMNMFRDINESKQKVVELLKERAKPVKGDDVKKIASTSLENDHYGEIIAKMIEEVGKEGYISVEDNWATQYGVTTDTILGMKFYGTYATPYLITTTRKEAIWEEVPVLVTNHQIESQQVLKQIIEKLRHQGKMKLVIISGTDQAYSQPIIKSFANARLAAVQGNTEAIQVLGIKAPSLTTEELEDVAVFTDAKFIDKNLGLELRDITFDDLGYAKKVVTNEDETVITGGRGNVKERIKILTEQLDLEKDQMFKEKLKRRIAALSSGVGIIRVGAMTETERGYLKLKIEDAVAACKAALEEGVVKGGGVALKEIAEELGKDNILYEALMAPYNKIQENAGGHLDIPKDIIDPAKVTRLAVENACSAAATLITTDSAIAIRKETLWDRLDQRLAIRDQEDDFRDIENQDVGIGRMVE